MKTTVRKSAIALVGVLAMLGLAVVAQGADQNRLLLPPHKFPVPKFGFGSFNIQGVGERVTNVRWGGLASRMGLEPGDTILSLNHFPLRYHGAWDDALRAAMAEGGYVRLRIRDFRTGRIVTRELHLGGHGPVTPKFHHHDEHHGHHHEGHQHDGHQHDGHKHHDGKQGGPFQKFDKEFGKDIGKKFGEKFSNRFDRKFESKFGGSQEVNRKFAVVGDKKE